MCSALEELYNDGVEEGFEKGVETVILSLLRKLPPETVAELINLPLDEVLQIQASSVE